MDYINNLKVKDSQGAALLSLQARKFEVNTKESGNFGGY